LLLVAGALALQVLVVIADDKAFNSVVDVQNQQLFIVCSLLLAGSFCSGEILPAINAR